MFGNTLVLPHADGNITLVKVNQDQYSSEYLFRSATQQLTAKIRHTTTKAKADVPAKDRHNVELIQTVFETVDAAQIERKVYVVIEQEARDTDIKLVDALSDWLIATAGANITSLLGWES